MESARPQENYAPLRENPLLYVIAVVDLVPIFNIEAYIPRVQDALRLAGYPLTTESQLNELTITPEGVQVRQTQRWAFMNRERTQGVSISESKIAVETTAYTTFGDFRAVLEQTLSACDVGPRITQRLGVRYVNGLQPAPDETFDQLFHERLAGFRGDFAGVSDTTFAILLQGQTSEGTFAVRVHQPPVAEPGTQETLLLSPDLSTGLKIPAKVDPSRKYRLLDFDHGAIEDSDFTVPHVIERFDRLHDILDEAFRTAVSQDAYRRWAEA